jgi:hypothetical protein
MRSFFIRKSRHQIVSLYFLFACLHLTLEWVLIGCAASSFAQDTPLPVASTPVEDYVTSWPVAIEATEGRVEMYQPQPESLNGNTVNARAAVSLTRPGAATPCSGRRGSPPT